MNLINHKLLKSLLLTEYCEFVRLALGFFDIFSINNPFKVIYKMNIQRKVLAMYE